MSPRALSAMPTATLVDAFFPCEIDDTKRLFVVTFRTKAQHGATWRRAVQATNAREARLLGNQWARRLSKHPARVVSVDQVGELL